MDGHEKGTKKNFKIYINIYIYSSSNTPSTFSVFLSVLVPVLRLVKEKIKDALGAYVSQLEMNSKRRFSETQLNGTEEAIKREIISRDVR